MFRKRLSSLLVAFAALDATSALGLGLGEITLQSSLNEPLSAEIRLRGTDDLGPEQILVRLAPSADFERSGIERLYSLTEMRFEVETSPSGEGVVRVRTEQPVREPYLDFLLEVRWPNGRVLREYTVLLDLPTYTTAPPPAVQAPSTRAPARPSVTPRSDGGGAWSGGSSYDVRSGDTLWAIAKRTRPEGASVRQMLESLHRDNPEAFVNGDINRLRAGAVLRIPAELSAGPLEAGPGSTDATGVAETSTTEAPVSAPATTGSEEAYLRLAGDTADDGGGSAGGEPGTTGTGGTSDDLATVQESLSAKERENAELASRVKALEEQVQDYQRVVDLKNEGMAAAQSAAATSAPAPAPAPAAKPAPAPAPEPSLLDSLLANGAAIGGAVLALFLGTLGFLFIRRRRETASYAPLPSASQRFRSTARQEAPEEPRLPEPVVSQTFAAAPAAVVAPVTAAAPVAAAVAAETRTFAPVTSTPAVQSDEAHDPLAEADMFVAYGRHERAMEVLRVALSGDPEQPELRLKLMEILAYRGEQAEFLAEYDRILALGSDDDVQLARTLAVETGHPHWLAELDAPGGIQSAGTVAPATLAPLRSLSPREEEYAPELSSLDLELQAPVPEASFDSLDLDLDADALGDDVSEAVEEEFPDIDHADFGELELGVLQLDEPADEAPEAGALSAMPVGDDLELPLALDGGVDDTDVLAADAGVEDAALLDAEEGEVPEALSLEHDVAVAEEVPLQSPEDAADFDLLEGTDEVETRLELAKAFVEMGDIEGAKDILEEVLAEGSESQRDAATVLLDTLKSS